MLDNQYLRHLLYRGLDLQGKGSLETCEILSVVRNCGVYLIEFQINTLKLKRDQHVLKCGY